MSQHTVSIRDAKAHLSELAERVAQGAQVVIAKHGKPTARLVPVHAPRKPIELARLQALTRGMVRQPESDGQAVRRLRDQARY
ncbi:MAG: type II toxin-antitoxin system Phd/YefM family antitoxin [Xanthomonadales bacterium PRO7]|nr:type II toxin-antitoxin system Phd/YefM family antitoxin [Xanthomonadales bacterium PRO7]